MSHLADDPSRKRPRRDQAKGCGGASGDWGAHWVGVQRNPRILYARQRSHARLESLVHTCTPTGLSTLSVRWHLGEGTDMLLRSVRGLWTDAITRPKEGGWWKSFRSTLSTDSRGFSAWHWTALDVRSRGAYSRVEREDESRSHPQLMDDIWSFY